ncbi:MAG: transglutaminase [Candidatus Marinimicrobia bacterium]|nr:transglutaminase [Candidatus Neomarinimicrobiota bacterium]
MGLIFALLSIFALGYPGKILEEFDLEYSCPTGLTSDGTNIWLADRKADEIVCLSRKTGKKINSIPSPSYWPMGLAWDGNNLWNTDEKTKLIYKIDPQTGTILKNLNYPGKSPRDITWDGEYLWVADNQQNKIYQLSTTDGTTIKSVPAPSNDIRGLAYDGEYLWCSDRMQDEIYMLSPESGAVIIITKAPGPFTRGVTFADDFIWAVDYQNDKLYKLVHKDSEKLHKSEKRSAKIRYTHQVKNFGPGKIKTLDVHIAVPKNRNSQNIENIQYNPKPNFVNDRWGQKTAHYHLKNIKPGKTINCVMTTTAKIFAIRHYLFPEEAGSLDDIPQKITDLYLENNEKYQIKHPFIQKEVNKIVGDEQNTYWVARKIFNYLIDNLYYERVGGWNTAPTVLERGNGSCSEYTFAFISMCRAAGLPARYVGSAVVRGDDSCIDDVFHRWAEVYFPGYGWVPVDPSGGDRQTPREQADSFGSLSNRFLITTESGGGSKTMQWTYNSNQFYTTEPKTKVYSEHIAEWEPIR